MASHARFDTDAEPVRRYARLQSVDAERYGRFAESLIAAGIWVAYRGIWYVSAAHAIDDVEETVKRFDAALTGSDE